jgi:hypothetical protein
VKRVSDPAAEYRDKAEQKMAEAANNPTLRQGLTETAKAWLELADKIEQAEALEAQAKGEIDASGDRLLIC